MRGFRNLHIFINLRLWKLFPEFETDEVKFEDKNTTLKDYEMSWLCFRFNVYFLK
jgi:hypothetical protein